MKDLKNIMTMGASGVLALMAVLCGGPAAMAIAGAGAVATGGTGTNGNGGTIDEGNTADSSHNEGLDGVASQTANERMTATGAPDFDEEGLSRRILELQPMKTPFDQLTRHATAGEKPQGMRVEYASIGSRPTETTTTAAFALTAGYCGVMHVADPAIFSVDDIVLVPGVKAINRYDGVSYASLHTVSGNVEVGAEDWPCLQLKVCGYDDATTMPVVYVMNGASNGSGLNIFTGTHYVKNSSGEWATDSTATGIPAGQTLLRIAKAVNEGASQTGRTAELPKTDRQYLQIFMTQTEESLIHKLTKRRLDGLNLQWSERRTLEDMRMVQEGTFLFSDMTCVASHPKENLSKVWTTKGAWYQAGKDVELGHTESSQLVIDDDDLVDVNSQIFVGEGTGGKKKLWFCGSKFITALEKIKSDKFRLKGDVQAWNLTFTSWKTSLGEALVIHDETLDKYGKSDCAFSLDPEYFEKRILLSLDRNAIDLNKAGIRATEAVVLKEISCVVLYAPQAHARIRLAK